MFLVLKLKYVLKQLEKQDSSFYVIIIKQDVSDFPFIPFINIFKAYFDLICYLTFLATLLNFDINLSDLVYNTDLYYTSFSVSKNYGIPKKDIRHNNEMNGMVSTENYLFFQFEFFITINFCNGTQSALGFGSHVAKKNAFLSICHGNLYSELLPYWKEPQFR